MNLELILALIGAITVGIGVVAGLALTIWMLIYRLTYGVWWWDEAADGLESGRG